jgi:hypothetical protein
LEQGQGVVDVNGVGEPQVRNAHAGIAFRFFPSLTDAMFVLPLVFLFFKLNGARTMLGDGDTGWHLRTGEWILAHGRVPDRDIFSFTKAGEPWYAWEWLWDVIFGWLHQNWGMAAVVLASSLVLALTFALLFRLVRRACDHEFIAAAVTLVACGASALHWLARPHLFTLLFLVILLSILERVREGRTRLLLWLPPLFVLWTNLHGGFIAGIAVILAYGAGELARLARRGGGTSASPGRPRPRQAVSADGPRGRGGQLRQSLRLQAPRSHLAVPPRPLPLPPHQRVSLGGFPARRRHLLRAAASGRRTGGVA